jgi:DNA helicase-2/ATP-dependent DNA helicase PcrA
VLKKVVANQIEDIEIKSSLPSKALKGIVDFVETIEYAKQQFEKGGLKEAFESLIEKINYKKAIDEEVKSEQMRQFKWENVQEFVNSISHFESKVKTELNKIPNLRDFLTTVTIENDFDTKRNKSSVDDKVNLMTFHSAKGLEFPVCFLVGIEDHIIPHEKSLKETGIEEERRLMYVAMTRAMKKLYISMAARRLKMGKEIVTHPSRFVEDIPKDLMQFKAWDKP